MTVCYSSFWLRRYPVSFHSLEFRTLTQKQTQQTKAQGSGCSHSPMTRHVMWRHSYDATTQGHRNRGSEKQARQPRCMA